MSTVEEGRGKEEAMQITLTHGDSNNKTAQEEEERENIKSIVLERVKEPKGKSKGRKKEKWKQRGNNVVATLVVIVRCFPF